MINPHLKSRVPALKPYARINPVEWAGVARFKTIFGWVVVPYGSPKPDQETDDGA